MPEWLKGFGSAIGFLISTYFAERRQAKKRKPKRVEVPDNIWRERSGEALRRSNGHSESGAELETDDRD